MNQERHESKQERERRERDEARMQDSFRAVANGESDRQRAERANEAAWVRVTHRTD